MINNINIREALNGASGTSKSIHQNPSFRVMVAILKKYGILLYKNSLRCHQRLK